MCRLLAETPGVPSDVQYALYCKALTFDRNLETRCGEDIVIAELYQKRYRLSLDVKEEFSQATRASEISSVKSLPIKIAAIDIEEPNWEQGPAISTSTFWSLLRSER